MSITFVRVAAPGEDDCSDRNDSEIVPTLPVVLGRGSLLKCGDKKISRRHAYLDWDDDGVMITSVTQNPTFIIAKGVEKVITEGDSCLLCHGDKFGLLKSNFWYQINLPNASSEVQKSPAANLSESKNSIEITPRKGASPAASTENSSDKKNDDPAATKQMKENKEEQVSALTEKSTVNGWRSPQKNPTPDTINISLSGDTNDSIHQEEQKENELAQGHDECKQMKADSEQTMSPQELQKAILSRKRELPSWLKKIDPSDNTAAKTKEPQHSHGGSRKSHSATTKRKATINVDAASDHEDSLVNQTSPKQHRKRQGLHDVGELTKIAKNKLPKNKGKKPSPRKNASPLKQKVNNKTKGLHSVSDDSEENSGSDVEQNSVSTPKKRDSPEMKNSSKLQSPVKHNISDDDVEGSENEDEKEMPVPTATVTPTKRKPPSTPKQKKQPRQNCQYGASCYRKNRKHLADFAHVGDPDFQENKSDSEDDDDDRPQCEYGIDCYRKNPRHRKDFRHSRVPQPQRRAKRKARQQKQRDAGSDSDDYDYDDPFLNDDSSDDYAPTDSDDDSPMEADAEEEEDTKRMLKEGKKFVKKR